MDLDLSDEQQLIRETARAFTDREIALRAKEDARRQHFELELAGKLAEVPTLHGGSSQIQELIIGGALTGDALVAK